MSLIYTGLGSPFRCEKLPVINGNPEHNNVQKLHYTYNHYTNTANNINRKLYRFKSCVNRKGVWIVVLRLKYCLKYWGHCPCRHFLTSLKTDLRRRSSNVSHIRTSIAGLLRTDLAARFWRASRPCLWPSPQQRHTHTQYSKIGIIRLQ